MIKNISKKQNIYLRGDMENPYHLSVGVVLQIKNNIVVIKKPNGSYTLPRETIYTNESLEGGLARCVKEEIGIQDMKIKKYLGSIITHFNRPNGSKIEKTTIYFLCKAKQFTIDRKPEGDEVSDEPTLMDVFQAIKVLERHKEKEEIIVSRL